MATITLTGNTNYSALTVANNDTIALAGFRLTLDVVPSQTGVSVTTVGTAGTVVFGLVTSYPLVGWTLTAGTGILISSIASGVTVGAAVVGGSATNVATVNTNNGIISGSVTGGSASGANGVAVNNGIISGAVTTGSVSGAFGVSSNNGTISGSVTGGSASGAYGVNANNGTISGSVTGGSVSGAYGVATNNGNCIGGLTNATGSAVLTWRGSAHIVNGPLSAITFPSTITTLYSLFGAMSGSATVDPATTVITLSVPRPSSPFLQQVIG